MRNYLELCILRRRFIILGFIRNIAMLLIVFIILSLVSACNISKTTPSTLSTLTSPIITLNPSSTKTISTITPLNTTNPSPTNTLTITTTSTLSANKWIYQGLKGESILSIVVDPVSPTTIYIGTYNGVFKSIDDGYKWNKISQYGTNSLAIDPQIPATIYEGSVTYSDGNSNSPLSRAFVLRSPNGGGKWISSSYIASDIGISSLAIDPLTPNILYMGTYHSFKDTGVYKSVDSGATWKNLGLNPICALSIDPVTPTTIYAGTCGNGIYKSTNGGSNWNSIVQDLVVRSLVIDPSIPTTLYAGTYSTVYKSNDSGESWSAISLGKPDNNEIDSIIINPENPKIILLGTDNGIYTSENGGDTWINNGLIGIKVFSLAIDPKTSFTIYAGTKDGLYVVKQNSSQ